MRRQRVITGLALVLAGCGSEGAGVMPMASGEQAVEAAAHNSAPAGALRLNAVRDPEAENGLTKHMLGGKAFVVSDFGSAPEGNAEAVIQSLEAAARAGSGKSSYEIHLKLLQCVHLLQPGRQRTSIDGQRWEDCKDIPPERLVQGSDWLRLAASQGHLGAQIRFASDAEAVLGGMSGIFKDPDAVNAYKRQSMDYLEAAARRGSIDALSRIADAYLHGSRAERDPVASYAYYTAMHRATPHSSAPANLRFLEKELTAAELERAKNRSMEIYSECCSN